MEYTIENISDWVNELNNRPSFSKYRAYSILCKNRAIENRSNEILRELGLYDSLGCKQVTQITEDMAVVCYTDTHKKTLYVPYVRGKKSFEYFNNLESALVAAVCLKQTGTTDAVKYVAKLMEVST